MKNIFFAIFIICNAIACSEPIEVADTKLTKAAPTLGAFSVSLAVKDLKASRIFYEKLGFKAFAGSEEQFYLIMKNGSSLIGLFHGMFEGNILTFNPGWDENAVAIDSFTDVRMLQTNFKNMGLVLDTQADSTGKGPANFMLKDPDGNLILIDQHVNKPE